MSLYLKSKMKKPYPLNFSVTEDGLTAETILRINRFWVELVLDWLWWTSNISTKWKCEYSFDYKKTKGSEHWLCSDKILYSSEHSSITVYIHTFKLNIFVIEDYYSIIFLEGSVVWGLKRSLKEYRYIYVLR